MSCRVSADIARLHAEQKRVREERKRVANELRNAQKRKQRLKHRARLLSNEDLLAVAAMRETDAVARHACLTAAPAGAAVTPEPVAGDFVGAARDSDADDDMQDGERRGSEQ